MYGVFRVVEVSLVAQDQWLVRGRVLRTIRVGETVYGTESKDYQIIHEQDGKHGVPLEAEQSLELYPFVVIAAKTYGQAIGWLDRGMTGDFVSQGDNGEVLRTTEFLIMPEPKYNQVMF